MTRFGLFLLAAGLAFLAGWLFGNEVKPPRQADISLAAWLIVGVIAVALGSIANATGRN